ncbi:symmetrical bis(5'-nucleosyl)-tetraphosphatase [Alteromonas facilis]|uniref:symmetrical bis(5'-nucleosyl)-tetraphosphatase n=1 Tax=Alteromonas facilis TaxID=2048004 RepID=UPI000C289C38|nr:symmetrical bis(5'-nucleosyl)-tetraphosphatase [Alteromonas facilis]
MAQYVVGDIQGCYKGLVGLLKKIQFDAKKDTLWAVGDLVARGEDSLSTLQLLYELGDSFHTVLGNHDLHLLAVCSGIRQAKRQDNLGALLASSQLPDFIDWLRHKPLATKIDKNTLIVHAGLFPQWSLKQSLALSDCVSERLQSDDFERFLVSMYGNTPEAWSEELSDDKKLRFIVNAMTRMRFLDKRQRLNFSLKDSPSQCPDGFKPWFQFKNPNLKKKQRVIFGHWAALNGLKNNSQFIGLDTGYVWGGKLTAFRLDDAEYFSYKKQT